MPGMIHSIPASPSKALLRRFMAENAGVAATQFSGWRRPLAPINVQAQGGSAEVLITWTLPKDPTINGFNVYQYDENNQILSVANPTMTQIRVKAIASMPTGFYVSSFNANKESVKVPAISKATSDLFVVTGTAGGTPGTSPSPPIGYIPGGCFSGNVGIKTPLGFVKLAKLGPWFDLVNDTGQHRGRLIVHEEKMWDMIDMGGGLLVTPEHPMRNEEGKYIAAVDLFSDFLVLMKLWGPVYNIEVMSDDERDLHYLLENGYVAHNFRKA